MSNQSLSKSTLYIFIDGASRNNPGPSGAGVYIKDHKKTLFKDGFYLGKKTNNQAEYLALLLALFIVDQASTTLGTSYQNLIITSDSELLVKQMRGEYKVKNREIFKIKTIAETMLEGKIVSYKHVLREKNKIADELANHGVDSKKLPPKYFINLLVENDIEI